MLLIVMQQRVWGKEIKESKGAHKRGRKEDKKSKKETHRKVMDRENREIACHVTAKTALQGYNLHTTIRIIYSTSSVT